MVIVEIPEAGGKKEMTDCSYVSPCYLYEEVISGDHASWAHMMCSTT